MIKYIGIILISGASSMYGSLLANKILNTGKQRRAIIELLYAIKNGISFGNVPLESIFESFENPVLSKCGFLSLLKSKHPDALVRASKCKNLNLPNDEKNLLITFACECGKSPFYENEALLCQRYIEIFEQKDKTVCIEEKNKANLYSRLGLLCGIVFALMLI